MMSILQDESKLNEMVQLVGMDALSAPDRLKMEAARSIREDYLHQDAFHEIDTYTSLNKQHLMMKLVLAFYNVSSDALKQGADVNKLIAMNVREEIGRFKYTPEDKVDAEYERITADLNREAQEIISAKEDF
jgi:V/A-type H+-transporting ATPase subunit A